MAVRLIFTDAGLSECRHGGDIGRGVAFDLEGPTGLDTSPNDAKRRGEGCVRSLSNSGSCCKLWRLLSRYDRIAEGGGGSL